MLSSGWAEVWGGKGGELGWEAFLISRYVVNDLAKMPSFLGQSQGGKSGHEIVMVRLGLRSWMSRGKNQNSCRVRLPGPRMASIVSHLGYTLPCYHVLGGGHVRHEIQQSAKLNLNITTPRSHQVPVYINPHRWQSASLRADLT